MAILINTNRRHNVLVFKTVGINKVEAEQLMWEEAAAFSTQKTMPKHRETRGETAAGSASLEGNDIDVQSVRFNLALCFPPTLLSSFSPPSSHPYLTSSLLLLSNSV